jgi:hypothetical protein
VGGTGTVGGHQVPQAGEIFNHGISLAGKFFAVESGMQFNTRQPVLKGDGKFQAAHPDCPMKLVERHALEFSRDSTGALVCGIPGLQAGNKWEAPGNFALQNHQDPFMDTQFIFHHAPKIT